MLDYFQAFFWSATYVALIVYAIRFKYHGIPLTAICLNFAWETLALGQSILSPSIVLIIHIPWFSLDLIIIALFLFNEPKSLTGGKKKLAFIISYISLVILLFFLFSKGLMLLSCFAIDLIMAIAFLVFLALDNIRKSKLAYLIGFSKLLGDLCAWLYYGSAEWLQNFELYVINIIGITVFICNIIYMIVLKSKNSKALPSKNKKLQRKKHKKKW